MVEITEPITTTLLQPDTITTTLSVGQGPAGVQGPTGPAGATGATGPQGPAGPATTDASLLVTGTLADARLSSNVALENVANVFTAKQSFSGTTHVGLCFNSLTTAQYNALTPANGDVFIDSTTNRVDVRLNGVTEELIDTRGGQTINGALTVGNTIQLWNASDNVAIRIGTYVTNFGSISFANAAPTANTVTLWGNANNTAVVLNTADFTYFRRQNATQFQISSGGVEFVSNIGLASNTVLAFSSTTDPIAAKDFSFTRSSAGVGRLGNGGANALGSLLLTNLTASGTINANGGIVMPSSGGYIIGAGVSNYSIGDVNDTIAFNALDNLFASPITLTSGGPLLRNNAGVVEVRNNANSAMAPLTCGLATVSEQYFVNGSDFTRVVKTSGVNGRLIFYRPNSTVTPAVSFGSGNEELLIGPSGEGSIRVGGGVLTVGCSNSLLIDSLANSFTFRGASSVTMATLAGVGDLTAIGTVTSQGVRLLQTAGGTLRGVLNCPSWDVSYVALRNGTLSETAANTGFYQSAAGDTVINAASGRGLSLNIANAPVVSVTSGSVSVTGNLTASGTVRLGTFTVGTLPSAAANTRAIAFVTDSNLATFGAVVAGGGANGVLVFSNGTNWIISGGTTEPQKSITSGTAAPSGGVDDDIYLQYT